MIAWPGKIRDKLQKLENPAGRIPRNGTRLMTLIGNAAGTQGGFGSGVTFGASRGGGGVGREGGEGGF